MKVLREKTDILIMEYASGALDDARALLMSSYIRLCPEARRFMLQCEKLGGALMEHCCEPAAMNERSMKNVLNRLDEERYADTMPPSDACLDARCEGRKWRVFVPGIRHKAVQTAQCRYRTILVRMAPGARIPPHIHRGIEMTLVLEGTFYDERGAYRAGDLVFIEEEDVAATPQTPHRPVAGDRGCLCLVLSEKPVRFTGALGSFLNALTRRAGL